MKYAAGCTAKRIPASYAAAVCRLYFVRQGNFYIRGTDVLPAPLEGQEEADAIAGLSDPENETARSELIEHNLRLVVYIAQKFDNTGVGVEDLISIGTIGLIKAINTFNPEKRSSLPRTRPGALRTRF